VVLRRAQGVRAHGRRCERRRIGVRLAVTAPTAHVSHHAPVRFMRLAFDARSQGSVRAFVVLHRHPRSPVPRSFVSAACLLCACVGWLQPHRCELIV
jgi:hypothetical protein